MIQASPKPIAKQQKTNLLRQMHPAIAQLADTITTLWQRQLMLFAYQLPTELGYVEGALEGERLLIQNTCYQTFQFRKLHLELAKVGEHLDILHCVMFPHICFNLPIFGVDIVAAKGTITAAIVDLSPVYAQTTEENTLISSVRALPDDYIKALATLSDISFEQPRDLPAWGDIFSDACLFIRPVNPKEERDFLHRVSQYLSLHCQLACQSTIIKDKNVQTTLLEGQRYYCQQQRKNDKTRRILERAFDPQWAQRYLDTILFDDAAVPEVQHFHLNE